MTIPTPAAFWKLNDTLTDEVAQLALTNPSGTDHYVSPGAAGKAWTLGTHQVSYKLYRFFTDPDITGPFTFSIWFRPATTATLSSRKILAVGDGTTRIAELRYSRNPIGVQTLTPLITTTTGTAIALGTNTTNWRHVVLRHNPATSESAVWLDGVKTTLTYAAHAGFSQYTIALGGGWDTSQSLIPCEIDALAFWTEALTDDHIADLYAYPEDWPTEEPSTIRPWPIWRWLDLASRLAQQSESEDLLYDDPAQLLEDLTTCQAILAEQFDLPPAERWYWSLRNALLHTLAFSARFAADANLGPLTDANPTQRFDPQTSFTLWGTWATATQDPDDRYNESAEYLAEAADILALLPALLAVTPAERNRDEILTALDTLGNLTTLFLADTRLMR